MKRTMPDADNKDDKCVAKELDVDRGTVGKWRRRFMRQKRRLSGSSA